MHVGNNSSSEAKHHVTERAQNSRVENKPPGARGSRGTLEEAGHQLPGDISRAPPPRFTAQGALCHPVAGAADPRCRDLTYETMPRRVLCIRHRHTGSRNEGIRSPTCPSTGLHPTPTPPAQCYQQQRERDQEQPAEQDPHGPHDTPEKLSRRCMASVLPSNTENKPTGRSHRTVPSNTGGQTLHRNAGGDREVIAKKGTNRPISYQREEITAISRRSRKMKHLCSLKKRLAEPKISTHNLC